MVEVTEADATLLRVLDVPPSPANLAIAAHYREAAAKSGRDAGIARLLEALRVPSEGMIEAGSEAANDGHCSIDADTGPWVRSAGIEAGWQAMLTAFQQENSDGR